MQDRQILTDQDSGAVLAAWGPMRLVMRAEKNGRPRAAVAREAAHTAFDCLERIAACRQAFKQPAVNITRRPDDPLAAAMVDAAAVIGDGDLTPMAAVAGAIADVVADQLAASGMDKVVVDNGGDIAIRLSAGQTVRVGLRTAIDSPAAPLALVIDPRSPCWGVATSGLGGRSFTRGIASAVTVVADRTAVADAAATAVANACIVKDAAIVQRPAQQIDPDTDLAGLEVTVQVGRLSRRQKNRAVTRALEKAEALCAAGLMRGCVITLNEITTTAGAIDELISMQQ
jgi:ApbE superfamily uncharacterized protein (UPF0280 family)